MRNCICSERVNLFEPNVSIAFLVEIAGKPSADDVVLAVKSAFAANEATLSRIALKEDGMAFYEKMHETACSVTVIQKDWKELIRENERMPFHIRQGELMRAFVIPSGQDISLLIMAHHLVGDGKSVVYFLEDIMKALAGGKLEYKPLHVITPDILSKASRLPLFYKLYVDNFNRKWKRSGRSFDWDDYYKIHETYWKDRRSEVLCEIFSREELVKIQHCTKEIGVSVNSYLTTAFLEANRKNSIVGMAVNARIDQNRSMSNQTTGISVKYTYAQELSFAENARNVHQKVRKKLDNPVEKYFVLQFLSLFTPTLIDSVLLNTYGLYQNKLTRKLAEVLEYKGGKTKDLGVTNLTRLDIPNTYGSYSIKRVVFVPPVVSYAPKIIGIATMGEEMSITYHYMRCTEDGEGPESGKEPKNGEGPEIKKEPKSGVELDNGEEREFFEQAIQNIRKRTMYS